MTPTHTEDCIYLPYDARQDCEHNNGVWMQPQGHFFGEAKDELGDDAPYCAVNQRAWERQEKDGAR